MVFELFSTKCQKAGQIMAAEVWRNICCGLIPGLLVHEITDQCQLVLGNNLCLKPIGQAASAKGYGFERVSVA